MSGESEAAFDTGKPAPDVTIVKAAASYETTSGTVGVDVTTAAEPQSASNGAIGVLLFHGATSECSFIELLEAHSGPVFLIADQYNAPFTAGALVETSFLGGSVENPASVVPATRTVSGTTTTLSSVSSRLANKNFNCTLVEASEVEPEVEAEPTELDLEPMEPGAESEAAFSFVSFPLIPQVTPPPPPPPAPPAPPAAAAAQPAPPPAPASLSIGSLRHLKLKVGKWKKVRVKVTNAGGTATSPGTLRVKAPAGIRVRPARQKLPVLTPGGSWTMSVRVKLTKAAKRRARLHLTAIASGVSGKRSLVIRRIG